MPVLWEIEIMMDKGLSKYDPHKIAEQKSQAIVHYREARRLFKKLTRIKEEKEKARYLHYRFLTNEKHSVEDAKAKIAEYSPEKEVAKRTAKDIFFVAYPYNQIRNPAAARIPHRLARAIKSNG